MLKLLQSVSTLTFCILALAACGSNAERTFGRGVLANGNVITNVLDDVGVYEKKQEPVDYKPRPPLAMPNSTDNLPKPENNGEIANNLESDEVNGSATNTTKTEISYNNSEAFENLTQPQPEGNLGSGGVSQNSDVDEPAVQGLTDTTTETASANSAVESEIQAHTPAAENLQNNQECELFPDNDDDNDCQLLGPPDEYN